MTDSISIPGHRLDKRGVIASAVSYIENTIDVVNLLYNMLKFDNNLSVAVINNYCGSVTVGIEHSTDGINWREISSYPINQGVDSTGVLTFEYAPDMPTRMAIYQSYGSDKNFLYYIYLTAAALPLNTAQIRRLQTYQLLANGADDLCGTVADFNAALNKCDNQCINGQQPACRTCNPTRAMCGNYRSSLIRVPDTCSGTTLSGTIPFKDGNVIRLNSEWSGRGGLSVCEGCWDANKNFRLATTHSTSVSDTWAQYKVHIVGQIGDFWVARFESIYLPGYYLSVCQGCDKYTGKGYQVGYFTDNPGLYSEWMVGSLPSDKNSVMLMSNFPAFKWDAIKVCMGCLGTSKLLGELDVDDTNPGAQLYNLWRPQILK
ncbi:hypothetical protein BGZ58_000691 [Dissophora ornata]|nr:hypothetical protein BGZ58_000691 [Dissophora ornata]